MANQLHSLRVRPEGFVKGAYVSKQTLKILREAYPENPRENGDYLGHMLCFHSRYCLGDQHDDVSSSEFGSWGEVEDYARENYGAVVILPLHLYDHSGVTMNTTGFFCPWDSGQVGIIYATEEGIRENWGDDNLDADRIEHVKSILRAEVKEYDDYLRGDVYCYELYGADDEFVDSCCGFYGDESIEYILSETGFAGVEEQ